MIRCWRGGNSCQEPPNVSFSNYNTNRAHYNCKTQGPLSQPKLTSF
ncbi:hypothetical protein JI435_401770 [Parastagonospora nodorum SN15]|uniref:Uncharacterized protein n=1 Tax=Phaeosphaeria nodorum (strain SN15 / ATCC MYA-4574 / FGSC 10173) TaxID=321614 RepID=A0A7U2HV50_PHANO|nr:hypothetical protein JI435_401770 [Parastagonospora nodorum SN15]